MSGPDQAQVSLVDQVGQWNALILVFLRYRNDETQIRADQLVQSFGVALANGLCQAHLLIPVDEGVGTDLFQVLVQRPFPEGAAA